MNLDARRLRAFVLLAKEQLRFSSGDPEPHALGHEPSIKALETEMGGALFDRRGHRAVLTATGERLLPHAERILRSMRNARQEIALLASLGPWRATNRRPGECLSILPACGAAGVSRVLP